MKCKVLIFYECQTLIFSQSLLKKFSYTAINGVLDISFTSSPRLKLEVSTILDHNGSYGRDKKFYFIVCQLTTKLMVCMYQWKGGPQGFTLAPTKNTFSSQTFSPSTVNTLPYQIRSWNVDFVWGVDSSSPSCSSRLIFCIFMNGSLKIMKKQI